MVFALKFEHRDIRLRWYPVSHHAAEWTQPPLPSSRFRQTSAKQLINCFELKVLHSIRRTRPLLQSNLRDGFVHRVFPLPGVLENSQGRSEISLPYSRQIGSNFECMPRIPKQVRCASAAACASQAHETSAHHLAVVIQLSIPPIIIIEQQSVTVVLHVLVYKFSLPSSLAGCLCRMQASPGSLVAGHRAYAPCSKLTSLMHSSSE